MWKPISEIDIYFAIADARFHALNLVYERFQRTIPSHSHGNGSYEIHYIPQGYGRALINGSYHEIGPGTLYVTGPHVEHAQSPHMEDPMCEYCIYLKMERKRRGQKAASAQETGEEGLLSAFLGTPFWFGQDTQGTGALIEELFSELAGARTGCELMLEAMLKQLLVMKRTDASNPPSFFPDPTRLPSSSKTIFSINTGASPWKSSLPSWAWAQGRRSACS